MVDLTFDVSFGECSFVVILFVNDYSVFILSYALSHLFLNVSFISFCYIRKSLLLYCCCSFFVCFDFIFVKHSYNLHLSLFLFFYCVISFIFLHFVNGGENSYSFITFYVVISFYIYLFSNCFLFNSFSFSQLTSVF